jgi:hypothetical protein
MRDRGWQQFSRQPRRLRVHAQFTIAYHNHAWIRPPVVSRYTFADRLVHEQDVHARQLASQVRRQRIEKPCLRFPWDLRHAVAQDRTGTSAIPFGQHPELLPCILNTVLYLVASPAELRLNRVPVRADT